MKITILSENNKIKLHNYYPSFFKKLETKYKINFINIKSDKKFLVQTNFCICINILEKIGFR